nr:MAG TPA: hypothetical protein [Caudoviricetes sp.]
MENNIQTLIDLAKEHPDLPIVAMVDGEIVGGDGYAWWLGEFGSVTLGEYVLYDDRFDDDRESFKERYYDNNDISLCEKFGYDPGVNIFSLENGHCTKEEYEKNSESEKKLDAYLDEVAVRAFKRAIIVYICTPDKVEEFDEEETHESIT